MHQGGHDRGGALPVARPRACWCGLACRVVALARYDIHVLGVVYFGLRILSYQLPAAGIDAYRARANFVNSDRIESTCRVYSRIL